MLLPSSVSLHILMIQPIVCLTVVCYSSYIVRVHNPDFIFCNGITSILQMLCLSSVRTVDSVRISCAYCDCYFFTGFQIGKDLTG
jgi:hypothetical protein